MDGFPFNRYASGWYQIGWSPEFPAGLAKPLRYFDRDLVAYRGTSGKIVVLDAHCPHMGANLGFGGTVVGDEIECPFHGWAWGSDGANTRIPDGSRPNRAQRLGCWSVRENSGLVLLWFDPHSEPPSWEIETLIEEPKRFFPILPNASRSWTLRIQPQVVAENSIDGAHFRYVHRASAPGKPVLLEDHGPMLRITQELLYGGDKPATWLTPNGPVHGTLVVEHWGIAIAMTILEPDGSYSLVTTTPISETESEFRMTNWVPRDESGSEVLSDFARRRIDEQFKQAQRDFPIWENMRYVERPPLSRSEAKPYKAFRKWSDRFYERHPVTNHPLEVATRFD